MPVCEVDFYSVSLDRLKRMNVIVPPGRGPYPTLYLLHGLSGNYHSWLTRSRIERFAEGKRLIIVMPDGDRSFYVNNPSPTGLRYEDYIIKDVIGLVDRMFRTIRSRRSRAVAGLSMGGYGSMMLAMRHPEKFAAVVSHSSAFRFAEGIRSGMRDVDNLSNMLSRPKYSLWPLARQLKKGRRKLAIRFDCGEDDFLIESSREFHAHLQKIGLAHEYEEHAGEHNWDYWNLHAPQTLAFVMKHLAKK